MFKRKYLQTRIEFLEEKHRKLHKKIEELTADFKKIKSEYMLIKYYNGLSNTEIVALYDLYGDMPPSYNTLLFFCYYEAQEPEEIDGVKFAVFKSNFGHIIKKKFIENKEKKK